MFRHFDPLTFEAKCLADLPRLRNVQNRVSPLQKANTGEFWAGAALEDRRPVLSGSLGRKARRQDLMFTRTLSSRTERCIYLVWD